MPVVVPPDASLRRRLVVQAVGILLVGFGVASSIRSELGVAPYDVLTTGIHERLGMPIGLVAVLLPILFLGAAVALGGRNRVGLGTLLDLVTVGPLIGLFLHLLPEVEALAPRVGYSALGFFGIVSGVVLVIVPDLGAGPVEVLMLTFADRGRPLAPVRTAMEVGCVMVGFALDGQVGVGTLTFAFLIGPSLRRALTFAGFDSELAATRSDAATPGA